MFGLFKRKSKKEKLEEQFKKLMQEWHRLSSINRSESDKKYAEAQDIAKLINELKHEEAA
ncbi:Lacal_2735 family protein [Hyunsoonleella pacifica]|uniref:Lacal_2735 family protein n=1 Tax=Hyunsoonleella pacifica TaxID=1080224 RepID=A0A4Q9FSY1_9FLAO|nr:Lacal_2735 family protein [Hyunsoonleella pacifica]TBN19087.1 Lacal_2735 family protein [Hyunsoonleella pacifica]GGD07240.1 hypothetical protein GCM10011368_06410 [Hyunsoonleella pacifica]